ncbi:MAG: VacJ family lipoprotein [Lentisphaeria bacterium]
MTPFTPSFAAYTVLATILLLAFGTPYSLAGETDMPPPAIMIAQADTDGDMDDEEYEDEYGDADEGLSDPLYHWNYTWYVFNDRVYLWLLKPAAEGYSAVMPEQARGGVRNFFDNLMMPVRFANCLLQCKGRAAVDELTAFAVNSTVGIVGFRNAAGDMLLYEPQNEDLGQTFGTWGAGHGVYLVWPFIGPSSLRDTLGSVGDSLATPINRLSTDWNIGLRAYDVINDTTFRIGEYESMKQAAIDPYSSLRDIYVQYRDQQVAE